MTLEDGRKAYRSGAWSDAYRLLTAASEQGGLEPQDLECLATAAYLTGADEHAVQAMQRAQRAWVESGATARAAKTACLVGFILMGPGERSRASGWFGRAARLLEDVDGPCVARGYVLLPKALQLVAGPDFQRALEVFEEAAGIGQRFGDLDLIAFARHGQARTMLRMGHVDDGLPLLDEVMIGVEAGDVSPVFAGVVYCSAIEACREIFDLDRARAWTYALDAWCGSQPGLVPYRGECFVQRAEMLRHQGAWDESLEESERACAWLMQPSPRPAAGEAFYQLAELHRLRGAFGRAETAYAEATRRGRSPQPGLARLRLAQGDAPAARSALERVLAEARRPSQRLEALPAIVDVALAVGDVGSAGRSANEIAELAEAIGTPAVRARADHARGAVLLAQGKPQEASAPLRSALEAWTSLGAVYEAACVRVRIGEACLRAGDLDTAALHFAAARDTFVRLGAAPALGRLEDVARAGGSPADTDRAGGLTPRELEVLRLVAAGDTNRGIGDALGISERTVERHVSNIFDKTGASSRAAATAFAYENDLL